ncbi:ATP-binding cassette domain-containing protein, partial [Ochrobactrum sp. CGA5]
KTTTLRAIMGIIRKRTGTITLDGKDILRVPLHRIARAGLGFVPEERGIFATLNVHENLLLPPVVGKGAQGAQGVMSLEEIYELFPNLYERRNSPGTKLSGGEQQMLAIARILRTGVKILLL